VDSPGEEGERRRRSRMIVKGESPLTRLVAKVLSLVCTSHVTSSLYFTARSCPNGKPTRLSGQNAGFLKSLSFLARQSASEPRALRLVLDELYYRSFILQGMVGDCSSSTRPRRFLGDQRFWLDRMGRIQACPQQLIPCHRRLSKAARHSIIRRRSGGTHVECVSSALAARHTCRLGSCLLGAVAVDCSRGTCAAINCTRCFQESA